MRYPSLVPLSVFAFLLTAGCDKDKPADDAGKKSAKVEPEKEQTKKTEMPPAAEKPAVHFDIEADKSGILARTSAVIETNDEFSEDTALREHLAELSHHSEAISSDQTLCQHVIDLRKAAGQPEGNLESCVTHFEHEIVILGPEIFRQMAQCIMDAKDAGDVDICEAAEKEAELLLHEKKHGDSLSPEVCEALFTKFEELAMADAGEHGPIVKNVLEEVKPDVLTSCADQGTQAEADCVTAAKDMDELSACQSMF